MQLLALDLGTQTGWACGPVTSARPASGTQSFAGGRFDTAGMVFLRFQRWLDEMLEGVGQVVFEEVRRHAGTDAAHRYGGLLATVLAECERRKLPAAGISIGTWKKALGLKGNANKDAVMAKMRSLDFDVRDTNEADALGVWLYGRSSVNF